MKDFTTRMLGYLKDHGPEIGGRVVAAVLILLASIVLARLAKSAVGAAIARRTEDRRAATLAPAVQSLTRLTILGVGIVTALSQLGVNVTTVLAGAGVLGLAVGFGAQTLVRDVISGFFLIVEGIIETGDHLTFDAVQGLVEQVGLRVTQIRSFDGRLWYVPNGEFKILGNFNRQWARAVVNIPLPHEQPVQEALEVVAAVGAAWAAEHADIVLEPPEAQGVLALGGASVDIRLVIKVRAMEHWAVERELARLLKEAFEARGMEPPVPRQVVYRRGEKLRNEPGAVGTTEA